MLSNAYFLANFRFDTAANEPAKNLQNFANFPNFALAPSARRGDLLHGLDLPLGVLPLPDALLLAPGLPEGRPFSKMHFSKILQIFGGLVFGCIKTKFGKKICV